MPAKPYILCVDDERMLLDALKVELASAPGFSCKIEIADSAEEGLEVIAELMDDGQEISVVISDQLMPGMKGDEFLVRVNDLIPNTKKIMLTGQASAESVGRTVNEANLYRFMSKPWMPEDLILTVEKAIQSYFTDSKLQAGIRTIKNLNKYANELSQEVKLEAWIKKLLENLSQDLHLTRAFIYLPEQLTGHLVLPGQPEPIHFSGEDLKEYMQTQLPAEVLNQMFVNRQTVAYPGFSDPALSKYRSVYIAPLMKGERLPAILYLENTKSGDHFNEERKDFLQSLTAQIPISLDNALLYENLEQKVADRTRIIEEKNQSITDSIVYAKRIQMAILPGKDVIKEFFPKGHLLYLPKDIVSGDFYWWTRSENFFYIAAADCTGHGVPGAFMSMLGKSLLTELVKEGHAPETNRVLDLLHVKTEQALIGNDEAGAVHDGMDIALCRFNLEEKTVQYSGANRPLLLLRNGQLTEYKADKQPIGGNFNFPNAPFTAENIEIQPGDRFYLYSDGITDQFGGEESRKKFGTKRMQELLLQTAGLTIENQLDNLFKEMKTHQGNNPQTDDILMIGLEI